MKKEGNVWEIRGILAEIAKVSDDWELAITKAGALDRIYELSNAALSLPLRNCDLFDDLGDAYSAWCNHARNDRGYIVQDNGVEISFEAWLFATAEAEGATDEK